MKFLYFLESIRNPALDWFFSLITEIGGETTLLVLGFVFFWCIDKKRGYFLLFTGFAGTNCIQLLKMIFRIPRPWVLDPSFSIVEAARAEATGYSFPSGHTLCGTTVFGGLAISAKGRAMRIIGIVICLLVGLSRMYLGVHTPLDVSVSLLVGGLILFLCYPLFSKHYEKPAFMFSLIAVAFAFSLANLLFTQLYAFPADVDPVNLADAKEVAWKLTSVILAMFLIYPVDHYLIRFETRAVWWAQLLKLGFGTAGVIIIKALLKSPLNALLGNEIGGAVRYLLMVAFAGILWPMTFRFFSRLGSKQKA